MDSDKCNLQIMMSTTKNITPNNMISKQSFVLLDLTAFSDGRTPKPTAPSLLFENIFNNMSGIGLL